MRELLSALVRPLVPALKAQVWQHFEKVWADFENREILDILGQTLQDFPELEDYLVNWWLDPTLCRWWLSLRVDWKAGAEVEWQIQAIALTLGLPGRYRWLEGEQNTAQVPDGLEHAARWLGWHEHMLLSLQTDSDEYFALVVNWEELEEVQTLLGQLGVRSSVL